MANGEMMDEAVRSAAFAGRDKDLARLLNKGGNHSAANRLEQTPLMLAAISGYGKCCQVLLSAGADPDQVCFLGRNALMYAAQRDRHECAEFLLNHVNPNIRDGEGRSALTIAISESDARMVLIFAPRVDYTWRALHGQKNDLAMKEMSAISKASSILVEESNLKAPKIRL